MSINSALYGQLVVFRAIASEGNITAAAHRLGVSAPSVSKSLKLLETNVGLPLFNRNTRRIELTEAGQLLLQDTGDAMQSLQFALERVRGLTATPAGIVRITVARLSYYAILRPVYAEFCARYPEIQLEISLHDGTVNILEDGFDLGIRFSDRLESGMVARQLTNPIREGLYASPAYIERHGMPQHPDDLANHWLIGYRFITTRRILPLVLQHDGTERTIDMPTSLTTNDMEVVVDSVRSGIGIGRLLEPFYEALGDKQDFVPIMEPWWRQYPALHLYYPQHSQKARRIKVLVDFLMEKAGR